MPKSELSAPGDHLQKEDHPIHNVPTPTADPRMAASQDTLRKNPPVTVNEDIVGRFIKSKGQDNAVRDAIRKPAEDYLTEKYKSYKRGQ